MEDLSQQDFDTRFDMTREFTCFLSNEYTHTIGSVKFNEAGIILTSSTGQVLEVDPFDYISSVNEVEPPNNHTLILSFNHRYVMLFYLLRKDKLVEIFKNAGLYKNEPHLPPDVIGMWDPDALAQRIAYGDSLQDDEYDHDTRGHMTKKRSHMTDGGVANEGAEEQNLWDNKLEQERHVQREIRKQTMLNPIQMLSSIQHDRASDLKHRTSNDYRQLDKYPATPKRDNEEAESSISHAPSVQKQVGRAVKPTDQSASVLANLKLLFPNHKEEQLLSVLAEHKGCDIDTAISAILGEDELANSRSS